MNVGDVMTEGAVTCAIGDSMGHAAQLMWDQDCGIVVVVDDEGKAIAVITDRDVCMAAFTQGLPLDQMRVSSACSKGIFAVHELDSLDRAEVLMEREQVRRLPVVDIDRRPVGILSITDLARHSYPARYGAPELAPENVVRTLAAISRPGTVRTAPTSSVSP